MLSFADVVDTLVAVSGCWLGAVVVVVVVGGGGDVVVVVVVVGLAVVVVGGGGGGLSLTMLSLSWVWALVISAVVGCHTGVDCVVVLFCRCRCCCRDIEQGGQDIEHVVQNFTSTRQLFPPFLPHTLF